MLCNNQHTWPACARRSGADTANEMPRFSRSTPPSGHMQLSFSQTSRIAVLKERSSFPKDIFMVMITLIVFHGQLLQRENSGGQSGFRFRSTPALVASYLFLGASLPMPQRWHAVCQTRIDSACLVNGTFSAIKQRKPDRCASETQVHLELRKSTNECSVWPIVDTRRSPDHDSSYNFC